MLRGVHVAETLLVVFASILVILVWFNAWTAEDGFRWWVPFGALLVAGIFRIAYQSLRVRHGEFSSVAARAVEVRDARDLAEGVSWNVKAHVKTDVRRAAENS